MRGKEKEKTEIGSFDALLDTLLSSRARLVLKKKNFVVKQHIIDARTRQAGAGMK